MIIDLIKGKNFRINKVVNGGVVIEVSNGSSLSSATVDGENLNMETIYAACDEVIPLYDGKTLKRIRDKIFIE